MKVFINASELARLLKVDRATVIRWISKGLIRAATKPAGTQNWRIPLRAYEDLIRKK